MQDPATVEDPPPPMDGSGSGTAGGISAAQFQLLMDEIKTGSLHWSQLHQPNK